MGKDKAKEQHDGETAASSDTITSPQDTHQDTCQSNRDLSCDHKAWDATLAKTITKAIAREMAKAHVHYQAILDETGTATIQTSLKVSSGANGFKVMRHIKVHLSTVYSCPQCPYSNEQKCLLLLIKFEIRK